MTRSRVFLRIITAAIWVASVATIALSFYTAQVTGYDYAPLTSFRTYNGILTASAFVLAIVILAGILTLQRIDSSSQRLLKSMGEALEPSGLPLSVKEIQVEVSKELEHTPKSSKTLHLQQALEEFHDLQTFKKDIKVMLAAPAGLLSAIFAISAWALPATEVFLVNFASLNTALLFFVTYGMVIAIASVLLAVLVMLSSGKTAA